MINRVPMLLCCLVLFVAPLRASDRTGTLSWWRARLAAADGLTRREARRALLDGGPSARVILLSLARDPAPTVRCEVALGLGGLRWAGVRGPLFALYLDSDPLVSRAAAVSLTRAGPPAHREVQARLGRTRSFGIRLRLRRLKAQILAGIVERQLEGQITATGGIGSWSDKYTALKPFRPDCVGVLLRIFGDPSYRTVYGQDPDRLYLIRELAGMALAEMGDGSETVRRVLVKLVANSTQRVHHQTARNTLYRLGHPHQLNRRMADLKRQLASPIAGDSERRRWLDELASCYYVKKAHKESVVLYQAILRLSPESANALYNMACSYALMGKVDAALSALKRAVVAGFGDRAHILADGDLKIVRKDPRFARQILGLPGLRGGG